VVALGASDVGALPADTPIPAAVTEQAVSGWGFTKNTGTYSKPSGGIPASDLASGVIPVVPQMATAANMSDWTSGKTVDAAALKTGFQFALQQLDGKASQDQVDAIGLHVDDLGIDVQALQNAGYQTATQVQTAIAAIPDELPAVTASDNGKSLVVENGAWGKGYQAARTPRVAMASTDTTPSLDPNKLYVFPEMATLTPTLATPTDNTIVNEFHFIFESGATPTVLTLPASVLQPDGFTVEANMHYEVSILEGSMTAQGWAVTST